MIGVEGKEDRQSQIKKNERKNKRKKEDWGLEVMWTGTAGIKTNPNHRVIKIQGGRQLMRRAEDKLRTNDRKMG